MQHVWFFSNSLFTVLAVSATYVVLGYVAADLVQEFVLGVGVHRAGVDPGTALSLVAFSPFVSSVSSVMVGPLHLATCISVEIVGPILIGLIENSA
ncbi:MAG: hypothetical protein AAGJ40_00630 [Planctomycetota bacterium]